MVLGGTGFVGRAISVKLAQSGWEVTVAARGVTKVPDDLRESIRHVTVDRSDDRSIRKALGGGVDVLVDVIPYEVSDGEQLLSLKHLVGSIVAISSASVYSDGEGRSLDESRSDDGFPQVPDPIPESHRTVEPGVTTYSTKKVAIEQVLEEQDDLPVTVIRPCAIYGPGDVQCREWFFVKRALDRRPHVTLAYLGMSVFHTTSVHNVAELVRLAAEDPGARVLNCGDPDPPTVARIARSIAQTLDHEWREVLVPAAMSDKPFLRNPWAAPRPFRLDMSKAKDELSYQPITTYEAAISECVEWVTSVAQPNDWKDALPAAAHYLDQRFDYEAEDAFVRSLTG